MLLHLLCTQYVTDCDDCDSVTFSFSTTVMFNYVLNQAQSWFKSVVKNLDLSHCVHD